MQYLSMSDLQKKKGGVGRNSIYEAVDNKTLPPPIKIGKRIFWVESEVDEAMRAEAAKAPRKVA